MYTFINNLFILRPPVETILELILKKSFYYVKFSSDISKSKIFFFGFKVNKIEHYEEFYSLYKFNIWKLCFILI